MSQYRSLGWDSRLTNEAHYQNWCRFYLEEMGANNTICERLYHICYRLPKLQSIRIEDRPSNELFSTQVSRIVSSTIFN